VKKLCPCGIFLPFLTYFRKKTAAADAAAAFPLLLAEGFAVGTLVHGGITLVGADQNSVQGAVVCLITMMGTLLDGTLDALICVTVHSFFLLLLGWY